MASSSDIEYSATVPIARSRILVIEDETIFAKAVSRHLAREGFECDVVESIEDANRAIDAEPPDLILLDMRLPDGSGLDLLQQLRTEREYMQPVIVMTAYGEIEDAVSAMKLSASDYLKKPVDLDELLLSVQKVLANNAVSVKLEYSRAREARGTVEQPLLGESAPVAALREQIDQIASLAGAADAPPPTVLITGETGTGKDVTARLLHAKSGKHDRPFVHVDCASLPKDLFEAELFGHVKGAFTNAHSERTGLLEMAEDGVVFLDEIGEVPLAMQAKLLAVLERRMLRRVGSSREVPVAAWFIAATNRDVDDMVEQGELRSDLYFRLNVLGLSLTPLRDRGDDALLLAKEFGAQVAKRYGFERFEITDDAAAALKSYSWPGNVRELKHIVERATLLSKSGRVTAGALMLPGTAADVAPKASSGPIDTMAMTLDEAERLMIKSALENCNNNVSAAARQLGITRMAMRYRMKKHELE